MVHRLLRKPAAGRPRRAFRSGPSFEPLESRVVLSSVVGNFEPTLTLRSLTNPTTVGNSVSILATLSTPPGNFSASGGTVTFKQGSIVLGTANLDLGAASITTTALPVGLDAITAVYDSGVTGSTAVVSSSLTQLVLQPRENAKDATGIRVGGSEQGTPYGTSVVTLTANIMTTLGTPGSPTGTLTFLDGTTALQTIPIDGGTDLANLSFSTSNLSVGPHAITAVYSGDASKNPSVSPVFTEVVKEASALEYKASSQNSVYGENVDVTVSVLPGVPGQTAFAPTGTVTFYATTYGPRSTRTVIGTAPVVNGTATLSTRNLPMGDSGLRVSYSGDDHYSPGSNPDYLFGHHVDKASSTIIAADPNAIQPATQTYGQPLSFDAGVFINAPSTATPTGTLTYYDGDKVLGVIPYNGTATLFTTPLLAPGDHAISVAYNGNDQIAGTRSGVTHQVIAAASTFAQIGTSATMAVVGQPVTYTAAVGVYAPRVGTPTGRVDFYDGSTLLGESTLIGGRATFTSPATGVGQPHPIRAVYLGDGNFGPSTSAIQAEMVLKANSGVLLAAQAQGGGVSLSASLTPTLPGGVAPSGRVTFFANGRVIRVGMLANGSAELVVARSLVLNKYLEVRYGGDANINPGRSNVIVFLKAGAASVAHVAKPRRHR